MLTESEVIDRLCAQLQVNGWAIEQQLNERQRGHDIIAVRSDKTLVVEAKGQTSSRPTTNRYGQPFDSAQVRTHVAEAFYKAIASQDTERNVIAAVAFPDTQRHRRLTAPLLRAARLLGITVFFVKRNGQVDEGLPNQAL